MLQTRTRTDKSREADSCGRAINGANPGMRTVYRKSGEVLEEYKDRQLIIYANGDWRGDDALGRLMQDFHCKTWMICIMRRWQSRSEH